MSEIHTTPTAAVPASTIRDPRLKSPLLAGILSAVPGLGQIYVGYYQRGFINAIVVAGIITLLATTHEFNPLLPFGAMFMVFFWLYNIIDASRRAAYVNQIVAGGSPLDVPEDFKSAGLQGSILGGSVLIIAGVVGLSHTAFDIPLDWLEVWWPLAPIGFGVFLVAKAISDRRRDGA